MTEDSPPTTGDKAIDGDPSSADRIIDEVIELDATPEEVWKALTDPDALTSWFPLEAEVEPGEGGHIRMGWGDYFEGTARIEIWEPGSRLRTRWEMGSAAPEEEETAGESRDDSLIPPGENEERPARLAVDYLIETGPGGTRLRLVHSGFGRGADWDDWFDGTRRGWDFQLCCLRHWLEQHPGRERSVAWARRPTSLEGATAWELLLGPGGLARRGGVAGVAVGDDYRLVTAQGDTLSGTVKIQEPPRQLALTVRELDDGLLRIADEGMGGTSDLQLFLSVWGVGTAEVAALEERWQRLLDDLLPAA